MISPISTPSTFAEEEETCLVDGIRKNQTEDIEADYLFTKDGLQLNAQFTSEESEEHEDEEEEEKGIWKAYIQGKEVGASRMYDRILHWSSYKNSFAICH